MSATTRWTSTRYQPTPWVKWHMTALPSWATACDVDAMEACSTCGRVLVVVEYKHAAAPVMSDFQRKVLRSLSEALRVPVFECRYYLTPLPGDPFSNEEVLADTLHVRDLNDELGRVRTMNLEEWGAVLTDEHATHSMACSR